MLVPAAGRVRLEGAKFHGACNGSRSLAIDPQSSLFRETAISTDDDGGGDENDDYVDDGAFLAGVAGFCRARGLVLRSSEVPARIREVVKRVTASPRAMLAVRSRCNVTSEEHRLLAGQPPSPIDHPNDLTPARLPFIFHPPRTPLPAPAFPVTSLRE